MDTIFINYDYIDDPEVSPVDYYLMHYGTPRHSGRYPWGSGENPYQRGISLIGAVNELKAEGMSSKEIADALGMSTTELRARISISNNDIRKAQELQIVKLKEKGMSNVAIGKRLGIPEPTVRNRLKSFESKKEDKIIGTMNVLREQIGPNSYVDVGEGVERYLGVSKEVLNSAIIGLKDEGYELQYSKVEQLGNPGNETSIKLLTPPDTPYTEVYRNHDRIKSIAAFSDDGGTTFEYVKPPVPVDISRIGVRYGPDGGADMDGIIQLRRGVEDLGLGNSRYAQVRISVDDTHFLKGMAMYADDLPNGVDIMFNTDKRDTGNKLDAMKKLKPDEDNPFGSTIRQINYIDKNGKKKQSPLNIVGTEDPDGMKMPGEEGAWSKWASKLSSQMLSKQSPQLAKQQLNLTADAIQADLNEIRSLNNPTVKKQLLFSFADSADSASAHLKATGLPRTANHVILPINSLKDNEVYAPNYRPGELVALVRHPHAGPFEIPILRVNNKNKEANKLIPQARDAIGINSKVAQRLSGADFDGDTVLVIPTDGKNITSTPPLKGLENFDPNIYKRNDIPEMKDGTKQTEMGKISNLITDMSLRGASSDEKARAARHSMVVIDAQKHSLDYKQSAKDNGIKQLKEKYQGGGGASTLISLSNQKQEVPHRRPRLAQDGGPIDPKTGEKRWEETGKTRFVGETDPKTGSVNWIEKPQTSRTRGMYEVKDAFQLSSGTEMEAIYATHANRLKSLANQARKEALATPNLVYSPSAKKTYSKEAASLKSKLNIAKKNAPLERHAQIVGNITYKQKSSANPNLSKDDKKKLKTQELALARAKMGAKKQNIDITPKEWEAIQAGAISNHMLKEILNNTDIDVIKQYALPKNTPVMGAAKIARARAMIANGYTQADVASALGVSVSTLYKALDR